VNVSSFSNGFIYYHLLPSATENIYIDPESREVLLRYKDDTRIHDVEIHKLPVRQHLLYKFNIRQYLLLDSVTNDVQPIELPFEISCTNRIVRVHPHIKCSVSSV